MSVEDASTQSEGYHFSDGNTSGHADPEFGFTWEYLYDDN